jgi:phage terminase small subunit
MIDHKGKAKASPREGMTARQQAFIREYLVDCNGTQAAIRAGYSKGTANVIACENLTKPTRLL